MAQALTRNIAFFCVSLVVADSSGNVTFPLQEPISEPHPSIFHFGYDLRPRAHMDLWHDAMYIMHPSDFLPHDGYVVSWNIYANATGNITFQIWRPVFQQLNTFTLVGYNNFTIKKTGPNAFVVKLKDRIAFHEGDLLGFYYSGPNPVPFSKGKDYCALGTMYVHRPCPFSQCKQFSFREKEAGWNPCRTYSIYADIINSTTRGDLAAEGNVSKPKILTNGEDLPNPTSSTTLKEPAAINVRLVNGRTHNEGLVLVQSPGAEWGTICDDGWDDADATVVCKQLGYKAGYARYPPFFGYGDPKSPIYLDDLQCNGSEPRIGDCHRMAPWSRHNCNHREDVGTECVTSRNGSLHVFGYPAVMRDHIDRWKKGVYIPHPNQKLPWGRGTINSWHFYLRLDNPSIQVNIVLQVWRKKPLDAYKQYQLIGHTKFYNLGSGRHDRTLTSDELIHFEAGDVIGVKFENFNPIPYDIQSVQCTSGDRVLYMIDPVPSDLHPGRVYSFSEKSEDWRSCRVYSLYATYDGTERSDNYQFAYGRSKYKVIKDTTKTRESATRQCETELGSGSSLAIIESEEEYIVLNGALNAMGLSIEDDLWIGGEVANELPFTKWAYCEPARGRECIVLKKQYKDDSFTPDFYYMHARRCHESHQFICQKKAIKTPSVKVLSSTTPWIVSIRTGMDFGSLLPPPTTNKTITVLQEEITKKGSSKGVVTGIVLAVITLAVCATIIIYYTYRKCRRRSRHYPNDISESSVRFVSLYDKAPL